MASHSATSAGAPYTWDDFIALDEDDPRELIDGELVEVEVPTATHEEIVIALGYFLRAWVEKGHGGRVLASGYKVRISDRRGVMPDLQYYRQGNESAVEQQQGLVTGQPDLVVEIVFWVESPLRPRHEAPLVRAARRGRILDRGSGGAHVRAPRAP